MIKPLVSSEHKMTGQFSDQTHVTLEITIFVADCIFEQTSHQTSGFCNAHIVARAEPIGVSTNRLRLFCDSRFSKSMLFELYQVDSKNLHKQTSHFFYNILLYLRATQAYAQHTSYPSCQVQRRFCRCAHRLSADPEFSFVEENPTAATLANLRWKSFCETILLNYYRFSRVSANK